MDWIKTAFENSFSLIMALWLILSMIVPYVIYILIAVIFKLILKNVDLMGFSDFIITIAEWLKFK